MSRRGKLVVTLGSLLVLLLGVGTAAFATHTQQTETHTIPYALTIAGQSVTGEVTIGDVDELPHETITETVTVTETTPPAPPPPPPPPPSEGTTLTFVDTWWRCSQPIASYATDGLPLTVNMTFTPGTVVVPPNGAGVVQLGTGCVGDGTSATDLFLNIEGDGLTYGSGDDAIRLMNALPGASNLQIEGHADCGPRQGAAHQDGIQILGGTNVTFRDFTIGDYQAGVSTCQGAGGIVFYSLPSENVDVIGGEFIGCNHALLAGTSSPGAEIRDAKFRSGAPNAYCDQFTSSPPCIVESDWGGTTSNLTCQRWNGTAWDDD